MLILASSSKPRSLLLQKAGISHKVIPSNFDEDSIYEKDIFKLCQILAFSKAKLVTSKLLMADLKINHSDQVYGVLGCDSLFEFEGELFGKPKSSKQAFDRWKRMSSSSGFLHTGHCLFARDSSKSNKAEIKFNRCFENVISTKIYFSEMCSKDILQYIDSGEPFKCAGGFALEGIGSMYIKKIEGCYSNVIGLSLPWLRNTFKEILS